MPVRYEEEKKVKRQENTDKIISAVPDKLFMDVQDSIMDSINFTSTWSSNQEKWHKLRMRIKKTKTFPFIGSSNLRMPTLETNIKKIKAAIMKQIFGIRPIVSVVPEPTGSMIVADKIEKFLDHLMMDVIKVEPKAEITFDQSLEKGFYLNKVYWRTEINQREEVISKKEFKPEEIDFIMSNSLEQIMPIAIQRLGIDLDDKVADDNMAALQKAIEEFQSGKDEIKFKVKDIIYDFPDVGLCSPERVYVPTDSGFEVNKLTSITHEYYLPLQYIKDIAEDRGWDEEIITGVENLKKADKALVDTLTDTQKDTREGIQRLQEQSELVRIWETYGYYKIDGSGKKKAIVTSFPDFKKVVRKVLLDTASGNYPFVKYFYELTDDRWFSHRGLGELLEDIIKEIDVQHNMKIDNQTITNAPMFVYRTGMVNPNLIGTIPNQAIPVNGMQPLDDTIKALNLHNPNTQYSYEKEQQILELKIQELVGQVDYGLQSQINKRQPRTLGEVELQASSASNTALLDVGHYINSFSDLCQLVFEEWCENGSDIYEFNYFGQSQQGEGIRLTKEELQGKYKIRIRGNDQNTNPQIKMQKAQQILMAVTNPVLLQSGVITPVNIAKGLGRFFKALGIDNSEELYTPNPQPQQPPDPTNEMQIMGDDMTPSEIAQVLQRRGIQPDVVERRRKEIKTNLMDAAEVTSKIQGEDNGEDNSGESGTTK